MKRSYIAITLIIVIIFLNGCFNTEKKNVTGLKLHPVVDKADDKLNDYYIDAKLDTTSNRLVCRQKVELTNRTGDSLTDIKFHLYANAFNKEDSAPFTKEEMSEAYPSGFDAGGIDISSVNLNGKNIEFKLSNDNQLLTINHKWKKNKKVTVEMEYTVKIPKCEARFGKGDDTYNMNNCYPILCAYKGKWITDSYDEIGDPFFSEAANYEVTITAPKALIIAASGELSLNKTDGTFRSSTYKARAVRDFAWVASEKFTIFERRVGNITVASYSLEPSGGDDALNAACKALRSFNGAFGEYPYNRLNVVCADFYVGGMEYPMLIMLDRRMYDSDIKVTLEYVTAHEVAHQWWYALVGNDEVNEPWLDEALTEFSTMLYFDMNYGENAFNNFFKICVMDRYKEAAEKIKNEKIDRPITDFTSNSEYSAIVYSKGAIMFRVLSELMGKENFLKGLKKYYEDNKFKIAEKRNLINALEATSGIRLDGVFDAWLNGRVKIE